LLITSRTLSTPVLLAASISTTSMSSPRAIAVHELHVPHGSGRRRVALLAVQALGEDARGRGLARPPRAAEQVRVRDPPGGDRLLQRARDVVLPDELIERPGSVTAGEDGVRHDAGHCSGRRGFPEIGYAPPTMNRAGFLIRLLAALIDAAGMLFFAVGLGVPVMYVLDEHLQFSADRAEYLTALAVYPVVIAYAFTEVAFARSPGKWLLRLRITRADGSAADGWTLLSRWTVKYTPSLLDFMAEATFRPAPLVFLAGLMQLVVTLGCLAVLGESRRAWHDRWSGTAVMRVPKAERQPHGFDVLPVP
jgi:uncharacterized RDD family membrane protein YckC